MQHYSHLKRILGIYLKSSYVPKPRINSVKTPGSLSIKHHSPPPAAMLGFRKKNLFQFPGSYLHLAPLGTWKLENNFEFKMANDCQSFKSFYLILSHEVQNFSYFDAGVYQPHKDFMLKK